MLLRLRNYFVQLFQVDPRSYRLFCILIGITSLWDVFSRFPEAISFYSSAGILSNQFLVEAYKYKISWSVNLLSRTGAMQQTLLLFQAVVSLAMITGRFGRVVNLTLWILVMSRQIANPYVLSAGDELLRHLLFWSCFLAPPKKESSGLNAGAIALAVQLFSVYYFSAIMKTSPSWRTDGSALGMAISLESFSYPFVRDLLKFPEILKTLTIFTWYLELLTPILFILSAASKHARLGFVLVMIGFHLTLACTFRLGYFPFVCISGWCLWLPEIFWRKLKISVSEATPRLRFLKAEQIINQLSQGVCIYLIFFTLGINFRTSQEKPFYPGAFLNGVGDFFYMWQKWGMFAPMPSIDDGWNTFEAILTDGTKIKVNGRGGPADGTLLPESVSDRPVDLGEAYKTIGWRSFLYSLHQSETETIMIESYLDYLCRKVIEKNPDLPITAIDFFYNVEWTKADQTKKPPEKEPVLSYHCSR